MWWWTFKISILSFLFILMVHHLFIFLRDTLTTPKVKDLVNIPQQKYEDMMKHIQYNKPSPNGMTSISSLPDTSSLPVTIDESMKDELNSFLQSQIEQSCIPMSNPMSSMSNPMSNPMSSISNPTYSYTNENFETQCLV